jgi:voltage-gated potassium channel
MVPAMNECPSNPRATLRQRWRFATVLAALLLLAVAQPLVSGLLGDEGSFDVFFSLLIGAVMLLVLEQREHRRTAVAVGFISTLGIWIGYGMGGSAGRVLLVGSHLLAACVFAFALYRILRAVLVNQASGDAIFGAVCGYLLLGVIWALLYSAVETASPGSFNSSTSSKTPAGVERLDRAVLSYYSFITLATVGYGDVTPTAPLTRTLAWIEAIIGQFYLAVLVAGLVGIKVTQAIKDQSLK